LTKCSIRITKVINKRSNHLDGHTLRNFASNKNKSYKQKSKSSIPKGSLKAIPKVFRLILESVTNDYDLEYSINEILDQLVTYHNQLIADHGVKDGTKRFNNVRLYILTMIEGGKPDVMPFTAVSEKYRFPSKLYKMLPLYVLLLNSIKNEDIVYKSEIDRLIRSLFYINRLVNDFSDIDVIDIEREFTVDPKLVNEFRQYIRDWKIENKFSHSPDLITEPTEKFVNNGPNGKPKWETADLEAYALVHDPLYKHFCELANLTGNFRLIDFIEKISNKFDKNSTKDIRLRFITSIPDKGNKSRLIAISDYWTQILLKPLMEDVQSLTEIHFKQHSDSKSHSEGWKNLVNHLRPGINSYDISAWTDNFPAELQKVYLEEIYSPELATAWYNLVVKCKWNVRGQSKKVVYGTGQGMGTAGSFDIATATDIFFLKFIYKKYYGIDTDSRDFSKVGDDLWCEDKSKFIYTVYTKELGLEINLGKTKQCTEFNQCAEYVSRNINYGFDVSRISANICRAVQKNVLDIPELCRHLSERDFPVRLFPIKSIIDASCKESIKLNVIRTFVLQTLLYPSLDGMTFLRQALKKDYPSLISTDPIIISLIQYNSRQDLLRQFLISSIEDLLSDITVRINNIFSTILPGNYECSIDLIDGNVRENSFKYDESHINSVNSLALTTSTWVLAKCYKLINELMTLSNSSFKFKENKSSDNNIVITTSSSSDIEFEPDVSVEKFQEIYEKLNAIYQGMTFKELGIISSTGQVYRPTTTKLYNLVKRLVYLPDLGLEPQGFCQDESSPALLALVKKEKGHTESGISPTFNKIFLPTSGPSRGLPEIDKKYLGDLADKAH
jgi:hypothetical protein